MMEGWEIKKLGEVLSIERGGSPRPIKKYLTNSSDGINWIKISDATASNKYIYETKEKITKDGLHKTRMVNEGDFLLSNSMSFGRPYIMKTSGCIHDGWLVLRQGAQKVFDTEFLFYLLSSPYIFRQFDTLAAGSTVRNLNIRLVSSVEVPLPPLREQQRIVSILDEAFAAIDKAKANAEQNLQNAKELFESYLQGVFENGDWEFVKLSEMATDITDGDHMPPPKSELGLPFITISNINKQTHKIDFSDTFKVPQKYFDNLKPNRKPIKGDVLYTVTGSYGIPVLIEDDFQFCFQRHIGLIRPSNKLDSKLLYYWILSPQAFLQANETATGTAQKTVSLKSLRNFSFPNIPLKEQKTIVLQLDALRAEAQKLEAVYQKKIDDLEELKKSILQKAFAGELTSSVSISVPDTKVIPLQKVEGISPTDLQAGITALALQKHIEQNQQHSFHHVKAEKIVHLSEYILNIDLNRNPVKDAAGPNDFPHAKKVESRARKAGFYSVYKNGEFYDYKQGNSFNKVIQKAQNSLGEKADTLSQIINILAPMSTQQAEIVATIYAAWNNLLLSGIEFTDEDIVTEARENWHKNKLSIERGKFCNALEWMKKHELLIPKGNVKVVKQKTSKKK